MKPIHNNDSGGKGCEGKRWNDCRFSEQKSCNGFKRQFRNRNNGGQKWRLRKAISVYL